MAVRSKPWAIDGNTHPAQDARIALANQLGCDQSASFAGGVPGSAGLVVDPGHGVTSSGALKVSQNGTPNMSVNVAAGGCLIRGTQSALQGVYSVLNDATVNKAIAAADATNARNDLIIMRVRDNAFDGSGHNDADLYVVTGTPAATPSDPSLASHPNALVLARVRVDAGATSITTAKITDLRSIAAPWADPRGRLPGGSAQLTSDSSTITTLADVAGFASTVTVPAGRKIKVTAHGLLVWWDGTANDTFNMFIRDGSNNTLALHQTTGYTPGIAATASVMVEQQPSPGAVTYKVSLSASNGKVKLAASPANLAALVVEDIGGVLT